MKLNADQQVLLAMYIECCKDLTNMGTVTFKNLGMEKEAFNEALNKINNKGYLINFHPVRDSRDKIVLVWLHDVSLKRNAIKEAEDLLNSLKICKESAESTSFKIFKSIKEDATDIVAKYFTELSKQL